MKIRLKPNEPTRDFKHESDTAKPYPKKKTDVVYTFLGDEEAQRIRQTLKQFCAASDADSDRRKTMAGRSNQNEGSDTSSILKLQHLAIDRDKLVELSIYDTESKQLIYLLQAQLVHQTRGRELTLRRALSTVEPIRSELWTISRQLRNFEKIVWY